MYPIDMHTMSRAFYSVWRAAGEHLSAQVDGGIGSWLRAHPYPPFLEHLSFRLGNQLFFIRVEDEDGQVMGPGNPGGVLTAARQANGHACVLPMQKTPFSDTWHPAIAGWGLLDAHTHQPIDPVALVTDEPIEMTRWELHDLAVQVVRDQLQQQGFKLMSWQGNPEVDPAIWFIGQTTRPEWVVVRTARYPEQPPGRPANWDAIAAHCAQTSTTGHFARVGIASADQPFKADGEPAVPLWRGHGMNVRYEGLE
jgi:hypothetical protein